MSDSVSDSHVGADVAAGRLMVQLREGSLRRRVKTVRLIAPSGC